MADFNTLTGQLPFFANETEGDPTQQNVVQQIGLSDEVLRTTFQVLAANLIGFTQQITHNFVQIDITQSIAFVNQSGFNHEENIVQYIGFSGVHVVLPASDGLGFDLGQRAGPQQTEDVTDSIGFIDHTGNVSPTAVVQWHTAIDSLGFVETAVAERIEEARNEFALADVADSAGSTYGRDGTQSFIKQHVSFSVSGSACPEKEYAPFIGESGDASFGEVSPTPPVLATGTLTLTYPRISPTETLILKNPQFGNKDILSFRIIDRRTRGGDRILFGDPKWSKTQIQTMELTNVCAPDLDDLVAFLNTSLGKEIGLTDWEGRNWSVVIIAPETTIAKQQGGYTVTLTFQGEIVP